MADARHELFRGDAGLLSVINANQVGTLLTLDLLYQVLIERTAVPGGGPGSLSWRNIEHIDETVTPDQPTVTFALAKSNPALWVLDVSQLGLTTTLAW